MYDLFLDDLRMPKDVATYAPQNDKAMYANEFWYIVRNYNAFCKCIKLNGLPKLVSFDHDLGKEHYVPEEYWGNYEASKQYQEKRFATYKEKTGYECAKWLVEYCKTHKQVLPLWRVHSMNPVGANRITQVLQDYKKEYN